MDKEEEFVSMGQLNDYFDNQLPARDIVGRFNMTKGKIVKSGLKALFRGEMLLFTWNTELVRIGRADSAQIFTVDGFEKLALGLPKSIHPT